jgi:hypothetical protein
MEAPVLLSLTSLSPTPPRPLNFSVWTKTLVKSLNNNNDTNYTRQLEFPLHTSPINVTGSPSHNGLHFSTPTKFSTCLYYLQIFIFLDFPILLPLYFCLYVKTRQALLIFSGVLYMSYLHLSSKVFQMVKINSNLTTVFLILNRTIWTQNKAYKSERAPAALCYRCEEVETMEHLLYSCEYCSLKIWD